MNPFVPIGKADTMIIDGRASYEIRQTLDRLNVRIVPTIECKELYDAISYHPDIVLHPIDYNTLIVAPNVYDYFKEMLSLKSLKLIVGEKKLGRNYPDNIAYNVARVSGYAFHNLKYTDEKLKFYLKKMGIELINVNQGYTKCSTSNIGDDAIITSDKSIYKELSKKLIEVVLIDEGYIDLPGMNYGFIGGATGLLSPKELLFTGQFSQHPSAMKIKKIMEKHGIKSIILSNKKIIDMGSIIPLKCN